VEQVVKRDKGNDLWAVVLVELASKSSALLDTYLLSGIPDQVKTLISEFDSIFQEPSALPLPEPMTIQLHCFPKLLYKLQTV
jgi:hypothetical protein